MRFDDITLKSFCERVADGTPTPGGGAVSAIVGAFAASLIEMVANLTIARKDYAEWHSEMEKVIESMQKCRLELFQFADKDVQAFDEVMNAYKLPKDTQEKKKQRSEAIQKALENAAHVPYRTCRCLREVLNASEVVAKWGNVNAISDSISAAELARSAFNSAKANVLINVKYIKNESVKKLLLHEMETFTGEVEGIMRLVRKAVKERGGFEV